MIESVLGNRAEKAQRFAIKKEPDVFKTERLNEYASSLGEEYTLRLFDNLLSK
jgi:hypothetical protein